MHSEILEFHYSNAECQRVQVVRWDSWDELEFLTPVPSKNALDSFAHIYRQFLIPAFPWVFGSNLLFSIPEDMAIPLPRFSNKYGEVADPLTAAAMAFRKDVTVRGKQVIFRDAETEALWHTLEARGYLHIIRGKLPITTVIPVSNRSGFLSHTAPDARLKVNSAFFIMDPFDCATAYDHVGTCIGLSVKNGVIESPPLYAREALLVHRDGRVSIGQPELTDLTIRIGQHVYRPGENADIYTRPRRAYTPAGTGMRLVIVGRRVVAVCRGGKVPIPASGFVLCPKEDCPAVPGETVTYQGMEDIRFGIQVGNSIVRNGEPTREFRSPFYNIRKLQPVPYPPSLYPMNFTRARAARIALGADAGGKPMLLWAEGAGKLSYTPGADSCGASLSEMARICTQLGMVNAVNLDGGGSAQILLRNQRSLQISDRNADNTESERPIPMGLIVR